MGLPGEPSAPQAPNTVQNQISYTEPLLNNAPPPYYSPPPNTTIVYTQPIMIPTVYGFTENPMQIQCSNCMAYVLTRTTYRTGALTWLIAGSLCFFGFWLGCQCIPFCIDACKDVVHSCPNCNTVIGVKKRI